MRTSLAFLAGIATTIAAPQAVPTITPPPTADFGYWDISMTYASVNTGAYWRNVTAIYQNPANNIQYLKTDCKKQDGPGVEPVDFCDNSNFSYAINEDGKTISVKQRVSVDGIYRDYVGFGVLDVTCATQRSCWGTGKLTATIA